MPRQPDAHHRPSVVLHRWPAGSRVWTAIRLHSAAVALGMCIVWPSVSFPQSDAPCKLPANTVSISQPASSQAATEVHMDDSAVDRTKVHGVIHLDLRNDGPAP
jgi:hypothetical protein